LAIAEYLERLSAKTPTPGGGSAAAIAGSLGAALVNLVSKLTVGKKGYEAVAAEMKQLEKQARELLNRLVELADQDSAAFEGVLSAYRLPKEIPQEEKRRAEAIEAALKHATEVPFKTAEACKAVLEMAEKVAEKGSRSAVSDAGAACLLAEGAAHAALLNVEINLRGVQDEKFRRVYLKKSQDLREQARTRRRAVIAVVESWIEKQ
jgi:formiminotetrahydrofolate cyclodeaminase